MASDCSMTRSQGADAAGEGGRKNRVGILPSQIARWIGLCSFDTEGRQELDLLIGFVDRAHAAASSSDLPPRRSAVSAKLCDVGSSDYSPVNSRVRKPWDGRPRAFSQFLTYNIRAVSPNLVVELRTGDQTGE